MIAMQEIQLEPQEAAAKIQGAENREQLNQEMMRLYKERGINPAGGCVPMLLQMPFLIVFYHTIRGLTNTVMVHGQVVAEPRYISHGSQLTNPWRPDPATYGCFRDELGRQAVLCPRLRLGGHSLFVLVIAAVGLQYFQMRPQMTQKPSGGAGQQTDANDAKGHAAAHGLYLFLGTSCRCDLHDRFDDHSVSRPRTSFSGPASSNRPVSNVPCPEGRVVRHACCPLEPRRRRRDRAPASAQATESGRNRRPAKPDGPPGNGSKTNGPASNGSGEEYHKQRTHRRRRPGTAAGTDRDRLPRSQRQPARRRVDLRLAAWRNQALTFGGPGIPDREGLAHGRADQRPRLESRNPTPVRSPSERERPAEGWNGVQVTGRTLPEAKQRRSASWASLRATPRWTSEGMDDSAACGRRLESGPGVRPVVLRPKRSQPGHPKGRFVGGTTSRRSLPYGRARAGPIGELGQWRSVGTSGRSASGGNVGRTPVPVPRTGDAVPGAGAGVVARARRGRRPPPRRSASRRLAHLRSSRAEQVRRTSSA